MTKIDLSEFNPSCRYTRLAAVAGLLALRSASTRHGAASSLCFFFVALTVAIGFSEHNLAGRPRGVPFGARPCAEVAARHHSRPRRHVVPRFRAGAALDFLAYNSGVHQVKSLPGVPRAGHDLGICRRARP